MIKDESNTLNIFDKVFKLVWILKLFWLWCYLKISDYILKYSFIILVIIQSKCNTFKQTKSSCSSNSMLICFFICLEYSLEFLFWNIKIDYKLDLWNIKASCQKICSDNDINFLVSEFPHIFISFFITHSTEDNADLISLLFHYTMYNLCKVKSVYKDNCLNLLHCFKHFHQEINLSFCRASMPELFDMF